LVSGREFQEVSEKIHWEGGGGGVPKPKKWTGFHTASINSNKKSNTIVLCDNHLM